MAGRFFFDSSLDSMDFKGLMFSFAHGSHGSHGFFSFGVLAVSLSESTVACNEEDPWNL